MCDALAIKQHLGQQQVLGSTYVYLVLTSSGLHNGSALQPPRGYKPSLLHCMIAVQNVLSRSEETTYYIPRESNNVLHGCRRLRRDNLYCSCHSQLQR